MLKVNFDSKQVFKLEKSLTSSTSRYLMDSARKSLNRFFVDQSQSFKMCKLDGSDALFFAFRSDSSQLSLVDFSNASQLNLNLGSFALRQFTQISQDSALLVVFDRAIIKNSETLKASDLQYLILRYPTQWSASDDLAELSHRFQLLAVDGSVFGGGDDLLIQQILLKNLPTEIQSTKPTLLAVNFLLFY